MEKITKEIIENLDKKKLIGAGNNSKCYLIDEENIILVNKSLVDIDYINHKYDNLICRTKILEDQGVSLGRIKDYKYDDGILYILETRVNAKNLYSENRTNITNESMENFRTAYESMEILARAPQEHFDKYVSDLVKIIYEQGLWFDHRHPDNIMYNEENGFYFIDLDVNYDNVEDIIDGKFSSSDILYLIINNITNLSTHKIKYRTEEENNMLSIIYEKIFKAIVRYAKQDDKKRIESKVLREILERCPEFDSENIIREIENLESIEKKLENLENIRNFRKNLLLFIRLRRIYNLSDRFEIEQLIVFTRSELPYICARENLNWNEEKIKLEVLDNETIDYLNDKDEKKKFALKTKCIELGLNFEEHIEETIKANNMEGEEVQIVKKML